MTIAVCVGLLLLVFGLPMVMPGRRSLVAISIPIVALTLLLWVAKLDDGRGMLNGSGDLGDEFTVPAPPLIYLPLSRCVGVCVRSLMLSRGIGFFELRGLLLGGSAFLAFLVVIVVWGL